MGFLKEINGFSSKKSMGIPKEFLKEIIGVIPLTWDPGTATKSLGPRTLFLIVADRKEVI